MHVIFTVLLLLLFTTDAKLAVVQVSPDDNYLFASQQLAIKSGDAVTWVQPA